MQSPSPPISAPTLVYLVGAGPGDPGMLTLRGADVLRKADVVLYDGLSNEVILQHAPDAQHISVGKHGRERIWRQDEINDEILRHATQGKVVVRLKGGDPAVFARTAEEVDAVRAAGIAFEIVPGITAALAAGSFAGIPITHRGLASAVALVTGHEEPNKSESALDWPALARFPGTLVVYMGVTTAGIWTQALMDAGKPGSTPAAILRRCSLPDQQTVLCRLDEVAGHLTPASKMRPPVIVIIGAVTELARQGCWFTQRPLFGQHILVTRANEQADELARPLGELGAEVFSQPAITIRATADPQPLRDAIASLDTFNCLALTSRNGVQYFFESLRQATRDARSLAHLKIAVVGSRTAECLAEYGLLADYISATSDAAGLVEELVTALPRSSSILWPRASRGPTTLADGLREHGHVVTPVTAYEHVDVTVANERYITLVAEAKMDWITVTSSAIANSLVAMFGENLKHSKLASLSPKTSETLRQLGYAPTVEAVEPNMQLLVDAIVQYEIATDART